ncbi:uncharacterized protein LOC118459612 [Anopheles albimanus]|uniref:uncharacterized protein LOC118459612 n=1 Tax=Anopheles albimanus TaxID=7167 RepID=UPI00163E23F4|nr:uncharacterized protein LOC118459612 [Anopheles albimanus]
MVDMSTVIPAVDDGTLVTNSHPWGNSVTSNRGRDYTITANRKTVVPSRQDFGRPEIVLNIFTDMYGQSTRNRNNRGGNNRSNGGRNSYWNSYQNSLQGWYGWQRPRNNPNYGMPSWQQSRGNSVYRGRQPMPPSNTNRRPQPVANASNRRNADQQASEALYSFLLQILQGSQVQAAATNNQPRRSNNRRP